MNTSALVVRRHQRVLGDAYLKFQINPETAAVFSMQAVQEVVVLPSRRLTPMPNVSSCMLGLMNRRSRVLWVIDLAQFLGLPTTDSQSRQYNLLILRVGIVALALAIHQVNGIVWLSPDTLQPPLENTSAHLMPYLQGCVLQSNEVLLVLDAEAVVQSPLLSSHSTH